MMVADDDPTMVVADDDLDMVADDDPTTEASGGRTPDLGFFLEVWVYIEEFCVDFTSGGSPGCPRGRGCALGGWARPPPLWAAQDSSGPTPVLHGLLLVHKKS